MEEDRKASARALRTFDGAPKGYWWIVGALVALASAAMLLHESGSWMLDLAPLWGAPVNIRAFSCDAHSLGLVFGYVATQICGRRFSRLVGDGLFWLVFFIAQVGNILLFYGCLTVLDAPFVVIVVQFIGAASGAWFFVVASQVACTVGSTLFMGTIVAVVALTTLIVQGLFSMLEATSSLLVSELLHVGLVVAAGLCLVKSMAPGSCFPESYRRSFAPIRAREDGEGEAPEASGESVSDGLGANGSASSRRRVPLCVRLFVIVGSYGMVFGFLHVIPLALPLGVVARVASFLVGAAIALALFVATLRRGRAVDVSLIWNRFYRFVFPAVCVAALLGPLTNSSEFLPALIMQACALYYFRCIARHGLLGYQPGHQRRAFPDIWAGFSHSIRRLSARQPCGNGGARKPRSRYRGLLRHRHGGVRSACARHLQHELGEVRQDGLGPSAPRGSARPLRAHPR